MSGSDPISGDHPQRIAPQGDGKTTRVTLSPSAGATGAVGKRTISLSSGSLQSLLGEQKEARLPALREDLVIYPGPHNAEGHPTWILHDPFSNRFFRLGWLDFEILSRWHMATLSEIAASVSNQTTLTATTKDVENLAKFFQVSSLFPARGEKAVSRLKTQAGAFRKHWLIWLVKNYLFFRLPLVQPDRFLARTLPFVRWIMTPRFFKITSVVGVTGILLTLRQWDNFTATLASYFSIEGAIAIALAIMFAKIIHEMAHGYTLKSFGCRVPTMGVAFLVMWPVLYTHSTDSWKLPSRRKRMLIGAAGIMIELSLAAWATLGWIFLPDGAIRSAAFTLATVTWALSLVINLNPFMRFDGYYLFSDYLRIPNLHTRAFNLGKWRLRRWLFGPTDPAPEKFPPRTYRTLLLTAYGTWIYRLFLFVGIAIFVYIIFSMFTKVLGIILFVVEIIYFIGAPIGKEIKAWYDMRKKMTWNKNSIAFASILSGLFLLTIVPWQSTIEAEAFIRAREYVTLYAPRPARVAERVRLDQIVDSDQIIFHLQAPDLDYQIEAAESAINALESQILFRRLTNQLARDYPTLIDQIGKAKAELVAFQAERDKLIIRAPFGGIIADIDDSLIPGSWIKNNESLGYVVDNSGFFVEAYITEQDIGRLKPGAQGWFYPDPFEMDPLPLTFTRVDRTSATIIPPYVAGPYGGAIPVRAAQGGQGQESQALTPDIAVYRIFLDISDDFSPPNRIIRGRLRLKGTRQSFLVRLWRNAYGVFIRESAF